MATDPEIIRRAAELRLPPHPKHWNVVHSTLVEKFGAQRVPTIRTMRAWAKSPGWAAWQEVVSAVVAAELDETLPTGLSAEDDLKRRDILVRRIDLLVFQQGITNPQAAHVKLMQEWVKRIEARLDPEGLFVWTRRFGGWAADHEDEAKSKDLVEGAMEFARDSLGVLDAAIVSKREATNHN